MASLRSALLIAALCGGCVAGGTSPAGLPAVPSAPPDEVEPTALVAAIRGLPPFGRYDVVLIDPDSLERLVPDPHRRQEVRLYVEGALGDVRWVPREDAIVPVNGGHEIVGGGLHLTPQYVRCEGDGCRYMITYRVTRRRDRLPSLVDLMGILVRLRRSEDGTWRSVSWRHEGPST